MRRVAIAVPILVCVGAACGLSVSGTAPADGGGVGDDASITGDATTFGDGASSSNDGALADGAEASTSADAASDVVIDAPRDACVPFDSGLGGPLALSAFSLKGDSSYNENGDGIITLTNSNNNEHGAAWYPTPLPAVAGYALTWSLRVGPNDTAGDGVVFAVLAASSAPGVGDDGNGLGIRNLPGSDGGVVGGYAVIVDMYKDANDPSDLDKTTLKLVSMPSFTYVTGTAVPVALNDGNVYAVDVAWRAPSTITATLHGPGGVSYVATSSDPRFATPTPSTFGFTASTGAAANSHNELAGVTIAMTCD